MEDALTVLVVEDNPGDARIIEIELKAASSGATVRRASTLAAGLAAAAETAFDLCLLDLTLPDASGDKGVRAFRVEHPDLPLVIMTGLDDDQRALEILREGAQDYLVKGQGDGRTLVRAIRHAIERQRLEGALRESQAAAERANKAKSVFLASMSHELRTPLNAILGFAQILESQLLGPIGNAKYAEYAGDIRSSGEHLLDLINEVLDLAKVEAGKFTLTFEAADLVPVVRDAAHLLEAKAAAAGLDLKVTVPPEPVTVRCDRRAIKQCLINLIGNAIKFCPAGRAIWVAVDQLPDAARIRVADTGIGIPAEALERLMRPFEQVETSLRTPERGTGLGLSLTRELVERHGGHLSIESVEGEGTTVTASLPKVATDN